MHVCENCNKDTQNLAFCPHCSLAQICPTCDRPYDKGAKFCGKCGEKRKGPAVDETAPESHQATAMPKQAPMQQQTRNRKIPPVAIGIAIAALVLFAIFNSNIFLSQEKQIEKVVTKYMKAVEKADYQAVRDLYHPSSPYMEDITEFLELPGDLTVEVHEFYDFEIESDYAEVIAVVTIESLMYDERHTEDVYVELMKLKNKWYLYDVY